MSAPRCDAKGCKRDALLTLEIDTRYDGRIKRTRCLRHQFVYAGSGAVVVSRVYHHAVAGSVPAPWRAP